MWGRGAQTPSGSDVGLARVVNLVAGGRIIGLGKWTPAGFLVFAI